MSTKATRRPNIRDLNVALRKLEAAGIHSVQENIRQRGFMHRLMARRPKRAK